MSQDLKKTAQICSILDNSKRCDCLLKALIFPQNYVTYPE